jgi:putative molybdopterin biosynthesis protein
MSIYLNDIPLEQAQDCFQQALEEAGLWKILGVEEIPLDENALSRILAESVWAKQSSPHYNAVGMDGFAVRAGDTNGALPAQPSLLQIGTQAIYRDTGDPLPEWADAVIPIENVEPLDESGVITPDNRHPAAIRIRAAVTPWKNVRPMGEDIVETQLVLPVGQSLRPVDLGSLAACGESKVRVARKPKVVIFPTGSELVPIGQAVKRGDIIEYNSVVLATQVNAWGGQASRNPITKDDFELIQKRVKEAAETADLILLNAGSSAGEEDFSARVVASLGRLLVHGVAVRPGHPVILGMINREHGDGQIPIIGVPGYPVSAAMTGEIFVEPLLSRWLGRRPNTPEIIQANLTRKVTSPAGDDDYLRVVLGKVNGKILAAPLPKGAGIITSMVNADGVTIIPRGVQGAEAGSQVPVRLYPSSKNIENTIFAIGSHDLSLDLLAQALSGLDRRLISVNVGSQAGLVALQRGEAHFAGSHLLDPQTGQYNLSAIQKYLAGIPVRLIHWVGRSQGLMVCPGNPLHISSLADLARSDVTYVNRQRGAGTRVLLDYQIDKLGIAPQSIKGYELEEYTHLTVAAAIRSGRADCGLGIASAAQALGLDFIPLYSEEYDLVIPLQSFEKGLLDPVMELAHDPKFRKSVAQMPGYDVAHMGDIVADRLE